MLLKKLITSMCLLLFVTQLQASTELLTGGGANTGEDINRNAWSTFGSTYISQLRNYNGKKFLYSAPKVQGSGLYQAFSTEIGKTYIVSANLIGANVNRNELFTKNSYITISSAPPTPAGDSIIASSEQVSGGTEVRKIFSFVVNGSTSYIALSSSKAWHYPTLELFQ